MIPNHGSYNVPLTPTVPLYHYTNYCTTNPVSLSGDLCAGPGEALLYNGQVLLQGTNVGDGTGYDEGTGLEVMKHVVMSW